MTWRIRGVSDECTTCEVCGREELKRTVLLETEDGDQLWAGTSCAGKKVGASAATIRSAANSYLKRLACYESWFPDHFRSMFGMTIREYVTRDPQKQEAALEGVDRVKRQWLRKNGFDIEWYGR